VGRIKLPPSYYYTETMWALISDRHELFNEKVFLEEPVDVWRAWCVDTSGVLRSITWPHIWAGGEHAATCAYGSPSASRIYRYKERTWLRLNRDRERGKQVEIRMPDPVRAPSGHVSPHEDCGCGFWVFKNEARVRENRYRLTDWMHRKHTGWLVIGGARIWGNCVEHDHGYRAQFAEPHGDLEIVGLSTFDRRNLANFLGGAIREKYRVNVFYRPFNGAELVSCS
jgi:hypothetical protein